MGFFKEFDERGKFIRSLDTTFLVLLPKKEALMTLEIIDLSTW